LAGTNPLLFGWRERENMTTYDPDKSPTFSFSFMFFTQAGE
jgi:hypothetical protein